VGLGLSPVRVTTRIAVELRDGRYRTSTGGGLLRAQLVRSPADRCRIGLLATTALLLGGDEVDLSVEVGPGATVELFDVAGTVAYHGRGRGSGWRVRAVVHEGAQLRWSGEPFVVSDGADVVRTLELDLAEDARVALRETLVLGRAGQPGGRLRNQTMVRRAGRDVLVEDQRLEPEERLLPGLLGANRIVDTVLALGIPTPEQGRDASRFHLVETGSTIVRHVGVELARSPLHAMWADLQLGAIVSSRAGSSGTTSWKAQGPVPV
jgi:urease accessory protein